jgi:tetratricopeptide (TPR) repeat protein
MTPFAGPKVRTLDRRPSETTGQRPTARARLGRLLLPAAFLAGGVFIAACSSGSPSNASSANALISKGLAAVRSGQTAQALQDFSAAAAKNPTSPIPYYDLGVIYQQTLNQPAKAASSFNKALLADPTYKPALYDLAILDTPNNPIEAINLYNQILRLNPNDANVNFNDGLLLIAANQSDQGHALLKKAISINPALASRLPAGVTP